MQEDNQEQIKQWLKKLEQESWQLELLVSAFTIFLLIQASGAFDAYLDEILHQYDVNQSFLTFLYFFLVLLGLSIKALVIFLIIHLLLRGFWIGTIGLRSVQAEVDFNSFNYSEFFTEKLKKRVISLDNMVVMLDEICSIIFSFAFLVISMLLAFGMHLLFLGSVVLAMGFVANLFSGVMATIITVISLILSVLIILSGLIYFIDYFTLGFFKKYKLLSKLYYPFYRFYGVITLSVISRSIYYYLINKFSKKRIRVVYVATAAIILFLYLTEYDQYQYYSGRSDDISISANQYDNLRPADKFIEGASIPSNVISGSYLQLFLRYDPRDNTRVRSNCPDFKPKKKEGLNWRFGFEMVEGGISLSNRKYDDEDMEQLLQCLSSLYQIHINDSLYSNQHFFFFNHPVKGQKGLMTMLSTDSLNKGQNVLEIKKVFHTASGEEKVEAFTKIPFWVE